MRTVKKETIKLIQRLPDECSMDDIIETLWIRKKIMKGQEQIKAGKGISHEEAKKRLKKWLK